MSRSSYSDDYGDDFPGQLELYRANVRRSIRSKNGQARLRELRDALLALPLKRLEAEIFVEGTNAQPQVCGLGAWALARTSGDVAMAHAMVPRDADDFETAKALESHGWPRLVVLDAIYMNDEAMYGDDTPERRYSFVLNWVNRNLAASSLPPETPKE